MKNIQTSSSQISKENIFTSKANVLKYLKSKIHKSKIEKIYDFTISEWQESEDKINKSISKKFDSKIIVRSSAIGEDSLESTQAGNYASVLNVKSSSKKEIKKAIKFVIKSYVKKGNFNPKNQILIQNQTLNIITSGVIFTKTTDMGGPYYIINFEEGKSTVGVTKGSVNNTIKIFRETRFAQLQKKWKLLIESVREIESISKTNLLDIEFGITKSFEIVIFQVRPITSIKKIEKTKLDQKIKKTIYSLKKNYKKLKKSNHLHGKYTIFSDMADWNPAEIIGTNPGHLDYSLYDYLIMKKAWHHGRSKIGYHDVKRHGLMFKFGNKPYVDIRASFNSLIPDNIDEKLKENLMAYYLHNLSNNPQLHDKVEFEILFTCYDLSTDSRLENLVKYNFSKNEIKKIKFSLINFTNRIIENFPQILKKCSDLIKKMSQNRTFLLSQLNNSNKNPQKMLETADVLLKDCRNLGTTPFSTLARIAFIAIAIFRSLVNENYIDRNYFDSFMNSINTPLSEFQTDITAYYEKKISKKQFLKKYGHLRPGTYDITEMRYDKKNLFFDQIKFVKIKPSKIKKIQTEKISKILEEHYLKFLSIDFLSFVKNALVARESLKFEFTHNLSEAIELIAETGYKLGFTRNEMSYLDIKTILTSYKKFNQIKLKQYWRKKIEIQKKKMDINNFLILPPQITSEKDFEIIQYYLAKPNFVTQKSITANIVNLNNLEEIPNLKNKIILLKNADPGYDWIFTRNPAGLITQYGGVASHMSIRCAETGLPAAIGSGEILYERLLLSSKVLLDCKNQHIVILEHSVDDEYIEVQKILKTLGYIK